jgi:hydrogenase nickel incorporation protein HypA/HybF
MHCDRCNKNFIRPRYSFDCPDCGGLGKPTEIGKEFFIESVELEV